MDESKGDQFFKDSHPAARWKGMAVFKNFNGIRQWQAGCFIQIEKSGENTIVLLYVRDQLIQ